MYIYISGKKIVATVTILTVIAGLVWLFTAGPIGQMDRARHNLETAVDQGNYQYFVSKVEDHGNRSYIPLFDVDVTHDSYDQGISKLVRGYEQAHPELRVVSWSLDRYDGRNGCFIHGIWIDHVPAK